MTLSITRLHTFKVIRFTMEIRFKKKNVSLLCTYIKSEFNKDTLF